MLKEIVSSVVSSIEPPEQNCGGCGTFIRDRFYLLAVDRAWHGSCLRCFHCSQPLDTELTCFTRDGNIYCKEDYYRLFSRRCARCGTGLNSTEFVMRARELIFHVSCFSCILCGIQLSTGDTVAVRGGRIFCGEHYDTNILSESNFVERQYFTTTSTNNSQKGRPRKKRTTINHQNDHNQQHQHHPHPHHHHIHHNHHQTHEHELDHNQLHQQQQQQHEQSQQLIKTESSPSDIDRDSSMRNDLLHNELSGSVDLSYDGSQSPSSGGSLTAQSRAKRMRTSFKHHQLRTMKSYFAINQNPDSKDLKQLSQKTGLTKRVLQVWFQNARAKWRRNVLRQDGTTNHLSGNITPITSIGGPPSVQSTSSSNMDTSSMTPSHVLDEMHQLTFAELY